jgi:hypothetical protein
MYQEINALVSERCGTASDLATVQDIRLDIGKLKWWCVSTSMRRFCKPAHRIAATTCIEREAAEETARFVRWGRIF